MHTLKTGADGIHHLLVEYWIPWGVSVKPDTNNTLPGVIWRTHERTGSWVEGKEGLTTILSPLCGPVQLHRQNDHWGPYGARSQNGIHDRCHVQLNVEVYGLHSWSHDDKITPVPHMVIFCWTKKNTHLACIHSQRIEHVPGWPDLVMILPLRLTTAQLSVVAAMAGIWMLLRLTKQTVFRVRSKSRDWPLNPTTSFACERHQESNEILAFNYIARSHK